jgi:uncharacterized protein
MEKTNNQTVLITGASSGIGLELAKVFATKDYDLVLVARRSEEMEKLKTEYPNLNIQVILKDLTLPTACKEVFEELKDTQIDILVNNAGFGDHGEFHKLDLNKQISMINLNVTALTELTHLFGSKMVERKSGKIMNVASIVAFMPGPSMATYFATKAFVLSLSQALSQEWGRYGVQVMALCPGVTASGFQESSNLLKTDFGKNSNVPTSKEVAEYGYNQLMNGREIAVHGFMNKVFTFLPRILPRKLYLQIIERSIR